MNKTDGVKLALATAGFSGAAVFINGLVVKAVGDALVFTTLKNLGVALVVAAMLLSRGVDWRQVRQNWFKLLAIAVIGGSLPFYLFFEGLRQAASVNAALIHKTLVFWVALWAIPVLKEKVSLKQLLALGLIFGSNLVIGGYQGLVWGRGETMILAATILWAVENVIAKVALRQVAVDTVVGARMILGSILLLLATLATGKMGLIFKLSIGQWGLTAVSVGLLAGYVLSWYRALKQAPVTLVATVLTLATLVTNGLSAIFVTHNLNLGFIYQSVFLVAGAWFFYTEAKRLRDEGRFALR